MASPPPGGTKRKKISPDEQDPPSAASSSSVASPVSEFDKTLGRAKYMFSVLFENKPRLSSIQDIKRYVFRSVRSRLDYLSEQHRERLMKRENAADLCIALGMNEVVVHLRFQAIRNFEREFNVTGKTHVLHSVSQLISTIDVDNPFGEVTDAIVPTYNEAKWLSYMGVRLKKGSLESVIETILKALKDHGYDQCFMHGTTGAVLRQVLESLGGMESSDADFCGHDFGPGIYCFQGNLRQALSFALDRSWPFEDGSSIVHRDNPSIVLFPEGPTDRSNFFHVGEHSIGNLAQDSLPEDGYEMSRKKADEWSDESREWKEFVKLARTYKSVPIEPHVFYGFMTAAQHMPQTNARSQSRMKMKWSSSASNTSEPLERSESSLNS